MQTSWYLLALAAIFSAGCDGQPKGEEAPRPVIEGEAVTFASASPQLAALVSESAAEHDAGTAVLNGRLTWNEDKTVRLYTPFAGRVSRIMVRPGDRVHAGQVLATIASPDFGQAQAEARRARGDNAFAQQNLARLRDLHQNGVAAAKDLHAAEAEFARAESELRRTEARLNLYGSGSEIDQTFALKTPLAGVVVEKNINPGQELRPDQMLANAPALFVITDPAYLWVELDAAEVVLPRLKVGANIAVRVPAYPGTDFAAQIIAVSDFLDPSTRTIKVRATLDNKSRKLKGEMFVTAAIGGDVRKFIEVPARAVFFQGSRHFVFIDAGGGRFERHEVQTGDAHDGRVIVTTGLTPGQKVVVEGALLLQQVLQPRRVLK